MTNNKTIPIEYCFYAGGVSVIVNQGYGNYLPIIKPNMQCEEGDSICREWSSYSDISIGLPLRFSPRADAKSKEPVDSVHTCSQGTEPSPEQLEKIKEFGQKIIKMNSPMIVQIFREAIDDKAIKVTKEKVTDEGGTKVIPEQYEKTTVYKGKNGASISMVDYKNDGTLDMIIVNDANGNPVMKFTMVGSADSKTFDAFQTAFENLLQQAGKK